MRRRHAARHQERQAVPAERLEATNSAAVRLAGLPKKCTLHGLRVTMLTRGSDAGWTTHEIGAWSGLKTLALVQHYTGGRSNAYWRDRPWPRPRKRHRAATPLPAIRGSTGRARGSTWVRRLGDPYRSRRSRFNDVTLKPMQRLAYDDSFARAVDNDIEELRARRQPLAAKHQIIAAYMAKYSESGTN